MISNIYKHLITSIIGIIIIVLAIAMYFFVIPFASHQLTLVEFVAILPLGVGLMFAKDDFIMKILNK